MKRTIVGAVILSFFLVSLAESQAPAPWTASLRGAYAMPSGSLGALFKPGAGITLSVGRRSSSEMVWEGVFDVARFSKGNAERLYHDSLSVNLEWAGVGVIGTYYPFGGEGIMSGTIHPFMSGGAIMTRWQYDRGSMATDTSGLVIVPAYRQLDWSLCLSASVGCEVYAMEAISLYGQASYRLVIGEIWPTLALRVEGASGFQIFDLQAGVRIWF